MNTTSLKFPGRAVPALILFAGVLFLVTACARSTRAGEVEPVPLPLEDRSPASSSTSEEVEKRTHEPVGSLLEGRFSGVIVTKNTDGSISVRIRGPGSFMSSGEPLYVIDGTPMQAGPRGALTGINPNDIESIRVLKHPPETSLYGVRGANGVIVIRTKLLRP